MEEADRRDTARREREAAKAASKAGEAQEASKVEDAPRPEAEEGVDEEMLRGTSDAGIVQDAQPVEEAIADSGADVQETMIHEEL